MAISFSNIYFSRSFYFNFSGFFPLSKPSKSTFYYTTENLLNPVFFSPISQISIRPFFVKPANFNFFSKIANSSSFSSTFHFNKFSFFIPKSLLYHPNLSVSDNIVAFDFTWLYLVRSFPLSYQFWFTNFFFFFFVNVFFHQKFLFFLFNKQFPSLFFI